MICRGRSRSKGGESCSCNVAVEVTYNKILHYKYDAMYYLDLKGVMKCNYCDSFFFPFLCICRGRSRSKDGESCSDMGILPILLCDARALLCVRAPQTLEGEGVLHQNVIKENIIIKNVL